MYAYIATTVCLYAVYYIYNRLTIHICNIYVYIHIHSVYTI